jgi:hypothetical protein
MVGASFPVSRASCDHELMQYFLAKSRLILERQAKA